LAILKRLLSALEQDLGPRQGRHLLGDIRVADGRLGRTDVLQCDLLAVDVGLDLVFSEGCRGARGRSATWLMASSRMFWAAMKFLPLTSLSPPLRMLSRKPTTLLPRAPEEIELIPTLT
jgi:hypothetical protein